MRAVLRSSSEPYPGTSAEAGWWNFLPRHPDQEPPITHLRVVDHD